MVNKNNEQIAVCKNYAKSLERLDENRSFKLISSNSILLERLHSIKGLITYNQRRRYFDILKLYRPGEILDSIIYNKELI